MRAWTAGLLLSLLVCASAQAADLTVRVRNAKGSPVANAVVAFYPAGGAGSARLAGPCDRRSNPSKVRQAPRGIR